MQHELKRLSSQLDARCANCVGPSDVFTDHGRRVEHQRHRASRSDRATTSAALASNSSSYKNAGAPAESRTHQLGLRGSGRPPGVLGLDLQVSSTDEGQPLSDSNLNDEGPNPFVTNIEADTLANDNYRTTRWTGSNIQLTLMSIEPGRDIGLEVHEHGDQFLRVEAGRARVQMGPTEDDLNFDREVGDDWAIFVPAGAWHNITNIGDEPLKVYAIYGPPEHPHGTDHATKAEADADEHHHH